MPRKKSVKVKSKKKVSRSKSKKSSLKVQTGFEKQLEQEFKDVEKWVLARKKFFKKLGWLVGLIALLLIVSHLYLRVKGVGV